MSLERARIIKATAGDGGVDSEITRLVATEGLARRVPARVVDAHGAAERILAEATAKAAAIVAGAAASAEAEAKAAAREARERELARLAAEVLVAHASAERKAEREVDRTIEVAVLLAERLIGDAIAVDPARVGALAVDALKETRGARQIRVEACAADVAVLQELLASLGAGIAKVEVSPELTRGSLIVHTELGRVDARLAPQLERLAEALREALQTKVLA